MHQKKPRSIDTVIKGVCFKKGSSLERESSLCFNSCSPVGEVLIFRLIHNFKVILTPKKIMIFFCMISKADQHFSN